MVDVKKMIIWYKILLYEWYNNISEISNKRLINKTYIKYIKNISIWNIKIHSWKISKVYNLKTANNFKKWNIMIAENTNPEYLNAFYNASFICVDTNSELSHAAITCSELNIPLALWAREIFLATTEKQKIKINTQQKIIYLYL